MSVYSIMFRSRNKDNKDVKGFKQRTKVFLTRENPEEFYYLFNEFVSEGMPGEMSRFYVSVNLRNEDRIKKLLAIKLIQNEEVDITKIQAIASSIADLKECAETNKWFFDYDSLQNADDFVRDVISYGKFGVADIIVHRTPHGSAVIVPHGFDTRELLEKWKDVDLKRDNKLCLDWRVNKYAN